MVQMLLVAVVWLTLTAALCLVIGRALRNGDVREEKRSRESLLSPPAIRTAARPDAAPTVAGSFAPELVPVLDDAELDHWGELWRWEDELRRGVDRWCSDADTGGPSDPPQRPDPHAG